MNWFNELITVYDLDTRKPKQVTRWRACLEFWGVYIWAILTALFWFIVTSPIWLAAIVVIFVFVAVVSQVICWIAPYSCW